MAKTKTSRITGGTFNLKYGRSGQVVKSEVMRLLAKHDPLFCTIQEGTDYFQELKNIPGYNYFATRAYPGGTETGILVKDTAKTSDPQYSSEGDGWITVRGGQHAPSTVARVTIDGWLRVASVHAPTPSSWNGNQINIIPERLDDYMALMRGIKTFLSATSQVRIAAGDWNEPPSTKGAWAPGWVADQTGAQAVAADALEGHGRIDYPIAKNCKILRVFKDLEIAEGSDHEPVIFVFEAKVPDLTEPGFDPFPPEANNGGNGGNGNNNGGGAGGTGGGGNTVPNPPAYNPPPEGPPPVPVRTSGKGRASLGGKKFRLNPTMVQWSFSAKIADIATVGGKVVQVLGTNVSTIRVVGTFGAGGWREQAEFLDWIKSLSDGDVAGRKKPIHFKYPTYGWDFPVMIKGYKTPDGGRSVVLDNGIIAPRWDLELFIAEGSAALNKVAQDAYIARLSRGLGWKQTKYNGPLGDRRLSETLGGLTPEQYLAQQYGIGNVPTGNNEYVDESTLAGSGAGAGGGFIGTGGQVTATGGTPDQNRALGKQMAASLYGWTGQQWIDLERLWTRESQWTTTADNPTSTAYGIPQSLPGSKMASAGADWLTNPVTQIRWGLRYIKERYGSPSSAWAHSEDVGWY